MRRPFNYVSVSCAGIWMKEKGSNLAINSGISSATKMSDRQAGGYSTNLFQNSFPFPNLLPVFPSVDKYYLRWEFMKEKSSKNERAQQGYRSS